MAIPGLKRGVGLDRLGFHFEFVGVIKRKIFA
jgi:hypothetical protein